MAKWFNWAGGGCERGLAVRAMEPCDRTIARMLLVSAFGEHTLWMIFSEWCSLSEFQSGSHTIDIPLQFIWPIQHTNTSTKSNFDVPKQASHLEIQCLKFKVWMYFDSDLLYSNLLYSDVPKVRNSFEFKNCIPYSLNRKVRYGMLCAKLLHAEGNDKVLKSIRSKQFGLTKLVLETFRNAPGNVYCVNGQYHIANMFAILKYSTGIIPARNSNLEYNVHCVNGITFDSN